MGTNISGFLRQKLKTLMQTAVLPPVYFFGRFKKIKRKKIIFADSNCDTLPESMQIMYEALKNQGFDIRLHLRDIRRLSPFGTLKFMVGFMKDYADARCVFICNYFVPVTACKKREGTDVVQLWHSCGLSKKFAYDAKEDISPHYKGSVTKNITLITVSSHACVGVFQNALRLSEDRKNIVKALGVSRTDAYFDENYNKNCRENFYNTYPEYKGKKIALWAPTFRGTAANPVSVGEEAVWALEKKLGDDWAVITKQHPHLKRDTDCKISTSQLFEVADILISDYSSLILEFAIYKKPVVIFAPDYEEYLKNRGFYVSPEDYPFGFVTEGQKLCETVLREYEKSLSQSAEEKEAFDEFVKFHCGACDGKSTQRIIKEIFKNEL